MEEGDEAPTSVTPLSPFMLLSLLGSLASLHLQLRVSGVLELWLGSCNTPLPSHAPLPATEPAATAFPVLQAGGGLPAPPLLPGPGSWRGSRGNTQSKGLRDPRRIPLQGSWGSHTSGFKQAAAGALEKHCPSSRILPFDRKWAPKKSCLETLPHESSPDCRAIPPTQIPFGHFLLPLLSKCPFPSIPSLGFECF